MAESRIKLLDKINFLLWLNSLTGKESKMNSLLQKLDGVKSVAGLLMVVAYFAGPKFGITVPDVVLKIGSGIASVGLAAKLEKGAGLLTKGLDLAHTLLDVVQKVVDVLAIKPATPEVK
jgi:hypothetical protein